MGVYKYITMLALVALTWMPCLQEGRPTCTNSRETLEGPALIHGYLAKWACYTKVGKHFCHVVHITVRLRSF